jgi:heme-degrading monooxygenase HmoA
MYTRIATGQVKPGMLDELSDAMIHNFEQAVAQSQQAPGFLGVELLINRESNRIAIVSRWATQADEEAQRQQGSTQQQMARMLAYYEGKPVIEGFESRFELENQAVAS